MRTILMIAVAALLSGCGMFIHYGGGEYTFIGPGASRLGRRCSPYSQDSWSPRYDYTKMKRRGESPDEEKK